MTTEERIGLAKAKVETVISLLRTLIQIRANNEFLLHSDALAKQVGQSYAANAFNVLTASLYEMELVHSVRSGTLRQTRIVCLRSPGS